MEEEPKVKVKVKVKALSLFGCGTCSTFEDQGKQLNN